jgi:hypothetical protein
MKKIIKRVLLGLAIGFIIIQFFRPEKNANATVSANHIEQMYPVPENVKLVLAKACYDCHSNNTRYPWYDRIQPVAWWLDNHVQEGKAELNFSEFGTYTLQRQAKKLKKSAHEVEEGEMPLSSYTVIHTDARLTADEKQVLMAWAKDLSLKISGQLPAEKK